MSASYNSQIEELFYRPIFDRKVNIKIEPNKDIKTKIKPGAIMIIESSETSESIRTEKKTWE